MSDEPKAITHPELIVGIAGPIGIDVNTIADEIDRALQDVGYGSFTIRVTDEMKHYPAAGVVSAGTDYFSSMMFKMDYANKLCADAADPARLMRIAIQAISVIRDTHLPDSDEEEMSDEALFEGHQAVLPETAYIIRQLKRPSEVALLRRIYGKQFVLVSAYGSEEHRRERIRESIRNSLPISTPEPVIAQKVEEIIIRDYDEGDSAHGQHLRDTFHLADVFVDGINKDRMKSGLERFFQAFFGRVDIGPSKIEYGMYAAKGASLRSTDLSRQVGAAIFSADGELITQGCNEVPKAFGGTYWDGEEPDYRDVQLGYDPNDHMKKEVMRDLLERLSKAGLLVQNPKLASSDDFVDSLLGRGERNNNAHHGCLQNSFLNDLTEYGRVVHAEMLSICDAARLGKSVKGSILFCTTFPCHNCTKHILASGIRQVIFMEPYPKSRAKQLHKNEIEIEKTSETRVAFVPFLGISPYRYRDIFEKRSRKSAGKAITWYRGEPRPLVDVAAPAYLDNEFLEISKLGGSFQPSLL
ncbi:anti-phage dCTP deaminase [Sphingopyxis sp. A083]|uniref:anti-phage dCTP deaminase n=1 Tax=Sphingopyxis sp. A083 TaxID=1759083 RepID=UPI0009E86E40|nr:anti-phage dCTP deaminase [Sphingopyxis sp. A083]